MTPNVGFVDRTIRIVVGLVPLGTALLRWCPAYTLFGIKTCKTAS